MKALKLHHCGLVLLLLSPFVHAGPEVDRLLEEYGKIKTVTCKVRRTKEGAAGKIKFLSRVYWTDKDQIHAEGIAPVKRRTIADGTRLYQYVEGDPKGFSRPIDELSGQMQISLRFVPGTAMDHLLRLRGLEESMLSPAGNAAKRVGLQADSNYVVLELDGNDRLIAIGFFKTDACKVKHAGYTYANFSEVLPGVWVALSHRAEITRDELSFKETVKIDSFVANKPIAESLFIPSSFFDKDVDFVDDFAKIFPE